MRKLAFILLAIVSMLVLGACNNADSGNENSGGKLYEDVTVGQAKKLIDNDEVVVIDVRTQGEYDEGHIPNAMLIPVDEIDNRMEEMDKDAPYLIVCRSGNRSATASELLAKNGFEKVKNMEGGMNKWTYEVDR